MLCKYQLPNVLILFYYITIDAKGKIQQKLTVLPYLSEVLYHSCMIGDFINSGIVISADYFLGDTKSVISVGFRSKKSADIPVTLYREDIKKLSHPTCKVLAIFCKEYNVEQYNMCTYLSKGYAINKLPEDIRNIINLNELYKTSETDKD